MNKVLKGHVDPWWDDSYKTLDYKYVPLKNSQEEIQTWHKQGYEKMKLNGGVYNMPRPMPTFADKFFTLFDWKNVGISFFCMKTCDFLPVHKDHYKTYCTRFNIQNPKKIWRAIVFLENWKSGHYMEVNGDPVLSWQAGDWVAWNYDIPHAAGNVGVENRYTLQITGYAND